MKQVKSLETQRFTVTGRARIHITVTYSMLQCMHQDMSEDAMPVSTNPRDSLSQVLRYAQIGVPAYMALLESIMDGADFSVAKSIIFIDLFPHVGNTTWGYWQYTP